MLKNNDLCLNIPSSFFEFLKKDMGEFELRDNPKFTSRTRSVDTAAKNRWAVSAKNATASVVGEEPDNTDMYLERLGILNQKVLRDSASRLLYRDPVLGYHLLSSTLVEKIGYVTYFKEYMTWYDLSDKLVDLLSIMTGTSTHVIGCLLERHLNHYMSGMSVAEFSRKLLSDRYIPAGFAVGLLDNLCPTVNNLFKGLISIGASNNYVIRGQDNLHKYSYAYLTGQSTVLEETPEAMTNLQIIDVYLCSVLRLLAYFILGQAYNFIVNKRHSEWDVEGTEKTHAELLTGWSLTNLVFQNGKNREFPTITVRGRNNLSFDLKPLTYDIETAVKDYLKGNLALVQEVTL